MKLGIFGGTFNPPHNTHREILLQAVSQLGLDNVLVVPCGDPPHKSCSVDKRARLEMACLAFEGFAEIFTYEIGKHGKSYTLDTLTEVKRLYPTAELYLIIGGDSLADFATWHCPEQIARMCTLTVAQRGERKLSNCAERLASEYGAKTKFLDIEPNSVSSTEIRLRYEFGEPVDCVPQSVDEYIRKNSLYSEYRAMTAKVKTYLTPERYRHTFYVVKRGLELAPDGLRDKAFVACLLHDVAKYVRPSDYAKYGFTPSCDMPLSVVHSFLGAEIARQNFGITDKEILDAIAYHTTGRPNMTELDKIVYVADKTEQTRPYPLEHLLTGSLDDKFVACLSEAYEICIQKHCDSVCPLSERTLEYYCRDKRDKT